MSAILSLNDLAWRVGIPLPRLERVAKEIHSHYRVFTKKIGKDKYRTFRVPDKELMQIQRRIVAFRALATRNERNGTRWRTRSIGRY